jgi:hypothetical protein
VSEQRNEEGHGRQGGGSDRERGGAGPGGGPSPQRPGDPPSGRSSNPPSKPRTLYASRRRLAPGERPRGVGDE